jgi:HSP20 family protein
VAPVGEGSPPVNTNPERRCRKMELKLWSPFWSAEREIQTLFKRLERAFGSEPDVMAWKIVTDMFRDNGNLVVKAEIPGIDPEKDVQIAVEGDVLHIHGEKSMEKEVSGDDRFLKERAYGSFDRRIPLPDGVDADKVVATYDKGVLTVKVPMPAAAEPPIKKVPVIIS